MADLAHSTGVVVIGRNEGERLRECLLSLQTVSSRVYVDSGSSDGSPALARSLGFDVVELVTPPIFSAARARNAGVEHLLAARPDLTFVQVVDGDCRVRDGWLEIARQDLANHPDLAVVFGRRRESFPDVNIFHRMCDDEWNVATGIVNSCGGDALLRVEAFQAVGGYDPLLIAGEEPDMCLRLRDLGWKIRSNGAEMTLHDIAMNRLGQWWQRARRAGFAFAELVDRYGDHADRHWRRIIHSALGWSLVALAGTIGLVISSVSTNGVAAGVAMAGLGLVALQLLRLAFKRRAIGAVRALAWSSLIMIAKLAQFQGYCEFQLARLRRKRTSIIEYK